MLFHQTSFGLRLIQVSLQTHHRYLPVAQMNQKMALDHSMPRKCTVLFTAEYLRHFAIWEHMIEEVICEKLSTSYEQDVTAFSMSTKSQNLSLIHAHFPQWLCRGCMDGSGTHAQRQVLLRSYYHLFSCCHGFLAPTVPLTKHLNIFPYGLHFAQFAFIGSGETVFVSWLLTGALPRHDGHLIPTSITRRVKANAKGASETQPTCKKRAFTGYDERCKTENGGWIALDCIKTWIGLKCSCS